MNTSAYRQWAEGVLSGQVVSTPKATAEMVIELLDYIDNLEDIVVACPDAETEAHNMGLTDVLMAARKNAAIHRNKPSA